MPGPLLAVDAPVAAVPRVLRAAQDDHRPRRRRRSTRCSACANLVLQAVERHDPRAVVLCFGAEAAPYRMELYPAYHADRPRCPRSSCRQWADAPAFFGAFGWTVLEPRHARGRRPARQPRAASRPRRAARAAVHRRPRHVPVRRRARRGAVPGRRQGRARGDRRRRRSASATAIAPEQVPDFIALRGDPSDGIPGREGHRREDRARAAARARHARRRCSRRREPASGLRPRVRAALRDQADELRDFREIATLQPTSTSRARPTRRPTARPRRPRRARARHEPLADAARARGRSA